MTQLGFETGQRSVVGDSGARKPLQVGTWGFIYSLVLSTTQSQQQPFPRYPSECILPRQ